MNRLISIEWFKLRHYRPFWVLVIMYAAAVTLICSSGMFLMEYIKKKGGSFEGVDPTRLPLYDFPDIWQNMAYVAMLFKVILGFLVVISIANEINFRTVRQNLIDGMSEWEWLKSKMVFMMALSLTASVLLFLIGIVAGSFYSHVHELKYVFQKLEFLLAYAFGLFAYMNFSMLIILIVRKMGLVIVGLFLYTMIFEPLLWVFLAELDELPDFWHHVPQFLPVASITSLIHVPFPRYILQEIQDYVALKEVVIVTGWLFIYIGGSYLILKKRDW